MDSNQISKKLDLTVFSDRQVIALYKGNHSAAILLNNDEVIKFQVESIIVGHWFEVFPIDIYSEQAPSKVSWIFMEPINITCIALLSREEWQEVEHDEKLIGSGPHRLQCSAPLGQGPASSKKFEVLAGIALGDQNGQQVVVCSSAANIYDIELTTDCQEIEKIMNEHTSIPY